MNAVIGGSPATATITDDDTFQVQEALRVPSANKVDVLLNGVVNAASLQPNGSQFTIPGVLVTGATLIQPDEVQLQTGTISSGEHDVTVGNTLTAAVDGASIDPAHNSVPFTA